MCGGWANLALRAPRKSRLGRARGLLLQTSSFGPEWDQCRYGARPFLPLSGKIWHSAKNSLHDYKQVCVPEMGHAEAVGPVSAKALAGRQQETTKTTKAARLWLVEVQKSCFGLLTGARSWQQKTASPEVALSDLR